ncbi:ABC transporter substrate-binding protein [Lihuaxuella thermophila]|uniref:Multiple sugar transport system substrate-binding protein n=1 Tax=Lihuaxuella thermophila TaxID=1173111 RepID=A0A1H8AIS6_9BACL|nr:ABC transporter substrate-binding protein [Lihuaxuella thermophila]SEM70675.1 multiple sugar transport system substrate-binding protein [Lihuaxuella thermophila]
MKRIGMLVLSFMVLAMVGLAGCSQADPANNGKVELTYWTLFDGGDGDYMNQLIQQFNKTHPHIQVKNVKISWDDYYTKLMTAVSAGKGPDVAVSHTSKLPELVNQGLAVPLDELAGKANVNWASFNQNILKSIVYDGRHYAVPIDTHPLILYYNKKYLKEAGLLDGQGKPILEPTPEGFVKFFATLKEKLPSDVAPLAQPTGGQDIYRLWWALYSQLGGNDVVADDLKTASVDKEKALKALSFIKDLFTNKFVKLNDPDFYKTFQNQKAAVMITGVWATGMWEKTKGLDFGAAPLPAIFGKEATWGDSHTLILPVSQNADEEKQVAALTFANWVADNGHIWAQAGHIPSKPAILEKPEFKKLPYRSDYVSVASHVVFSKHSDNNWSIRDQAMIKNFDACLQNKLTPEQAIENMEKTVNDLLQK